jgi:hypothetical protein
MGTSTPAPAIESAVAGAFFVSAVAGFEKNLCLVVAALAGHGIFDCFHRIVYGLLFRASAATPLEIAADARRLGAEIDVSYRCL